jgi:maltooligosyltrehalose trehalohydrolase
MIEMPRGAFPVSAQAPAFRVGALRAERLGLRPFDPPRDVEMTRVEDGYFVVRTKAPPGSLGQYRFPDGRRRPDPASRSQPQGAHGPSAREVLIAHVLPRAHEWNTAAAAGRWQELMRERGEVQAVGV